MDAERPAPAHRQRLLALVGETASGKTALAVQLAEQLGGEIVGADSIQVYRGLDLGSAKPTSDELRGVPHHMLDLLEPHEVRDGMWYALHAARVIDDVTQRGKLPIVVGGTGLWLRALLRGLVELPAVDPPLRARLWQQWQEQGALAMHSRLARVDPIAAARLHPNDRKRVVRALEVFEQTGYPLGKLQADHSRGEPRYRAHVILVQRPTEEIRKRIHSRCRRMLDLGWLDEVRRLVGHHGAGAVALRSVGYRQLVHHLQHDTPREQAIEAAIAATCQYAKRQRTWFKTDPDVSERGRPEQLCAALALARLQRLLASGPES